jgi:poly(3-hydroxybutyrate) depolymerase
MTHRGDPVDLTAIRRTAIMAIEGEKDDISGIGQTQAALDLCTSVPASRKRYHLQKDVGHYGVFNGSRFRAEIAPAIRAFTAAYPSHAVQSTDATVTPIRKAGKAG